MSAEGNVIWRKLAAIHQHYAAEMLCEDGKSVAETLSSIEGQKSFQVMRAQFSPLFRRGKPPKSEFVFQQTIQRLDEQAERIRADLIRHMLEEAGAAKWVAAGRRKPNLPHELVPSSHWPFLTLDIANNAALGDDVSFRDLRCAIATEIPSNDPILNQLQTSDSKAAGTGAPGRPSGMYLVRQEFERRRDSRSLKVTLGEESEFLSSWCRKNHPDRPCPSPKTVKNNLRDDYRAAQDSRQQIQPEI